MASRSPTGVSLTINETELIAKAALALQFEMSMPSKVALPVFVVALLVFSALVERCRREFKLERVIRVFDELMLFTLL